jgi:acetyl-CoA carboxylase biotin carboxyl carrier protein
LNKKSRNGGKSAAKNNASSSSAASSSSSPMDVSLLERMVKLMAANDLNTVDVRDGDKRVILKRGAAFVAPNASSGGYAFPHMAAPVPASTPSPGLASGATKDASDDEAGLTAIKSPMVGTFYAAPSPDAKPFVSVGSRVDDETDVCVIEAMKVFNNIKAEMTGTIAKVLVTNGQTVEFGQTLFLVKP